MAILVLQHEFFYYWYLPSFTAEDSNMPLSVHEFSSDLKVPRPEYHSIGFQMYLEDFSTMLKSTSWITCMSMYGQPQVDDSSDDEF